MILKNMNLEGSRTLFVEDTVRNLSIPHRLGMGTVLLHYGQKPQNFPDYVDADYNNASELLQDVLQQNKK